MGRQAERALLRWKWAAIAATVVAVCSLIGLVAAVAARPARVTDDRLLGAWQSDADRTVAGIRERRPVDDKQEAALRTLFGKLRVTYTRTTLTTDLDGKAEAVRCEVLGKDRYSVVIREMRDKPSPLDGIAEVSDFTVVQFDGPDSYWVTAQLGGVREYFKRVR